MKGKTKFTCVDGPLRGQSLWLDTQANTFVFKLKAWVGRYVRAGSDTVRWEPAQ